MVIDPEEVTKGKGKKKLKILEYQLTLPYLDKINKDQQDEKFKKFFDVQHATHQCVIHGAVDTNATLRKIFEGIAYKQEEIGRCFNSHT